jgi:hypothetical protein
MPCKKCGVDGHNIRTCTQEKTTNKNKNNRDNNDCCVCYEELETGNGRVTTPCGHNYCALCFVNWMRKSGRCAYCREEICDAPGKYQPISEDVQERLISDLLEGEELTKEVVKDIRTQIVHGLWDRWGVIPNGIEQVIEDVFDPVYIMSIVGYDVLSIVSEHYTNE